jgi:hypothetical protein
METENGDRKWRQKMETEIGANKQLDEESEEVSEEESDAESDAESEPFGDVLKTMRYPTTLLWVPVTSFPIAKLSFHDLQGYIDH